MKDMFFKSISFALTGYVGYSIVEFFSDNAPLYRLVIGALFGVIFSYYWHKNAIEPMAKSNNKAMVIVLSLPFVISWVMITPNAYNLYLNKYVAPAIGEHNYIDKEQRVKELESALKVAGDVKRDSKKAISSITIDVLI